MKILHAYCLNYNLGDHALGFGLKHVLREMFPVDLISEVNLQGQIFDRRFIEIVNSTYDLLVIGGGGIIHGSHWPNGWFWLIEESLIKEIKIPFIIASAGYNYFKDETGIPPHGRRHLRETKKYARLFSVRNDGSHSRLFHDTGIDAKVVADPGFWVAKARPGGYQPPVELAQPYVLLQVANDKLSHRIGEKMGYIDLVNELRDVVRIISKDIKVVLCPHVWADVELSRDIVKGIDNTSIWPFSTFAFDRVEEIFGYYQHAEAVLAMRGHGQILGMAFGIPTISLENHFKHRGLMEDMGLGEFNIDVRSPDLGRLASALVIDARKRRDEIRDRLDRRLDKLWVETREQYAGVLNEL
jgi:polysaccharide pyruvyl transferase WcaK-like protein